MDCGCVCAQAYGSLPKFDAQKRLVGYDYARPNLLLQFLNSAAPAPTLVQIWPVLRIRARSSVVALVCGFNIRMTVRVQQVCWV